jgi:hypothetical protein
LQVVRVMPHKTSLLIEKDCYILFLLFLSGVMWAEETFKLSKGIKGDTAKP